MNHYSKTKRKEGKEKKTHLIKLKEINYWKKEKRRGKVCYWMNQESENLGGMKIIMKNRNREEYIDRHARKYSHSNSEEGKWIKEYDDGRKEGVWNEMFEVYDKCG